MGPAATIREPAGTLERVVPLDLLWLLSGLALLIGGAELLVRGAVGLARRFRVPRLVIGLTVVAFGTSTPELMVNLDAAFRDVQDIGFGNIIGSNIANIGLLLGVTALVSPIAVHANVVVREIPMMVLVSTAGLVIVADQLLAGRAVDLVDRGDGLILLLLFALFLHYLIVDLVRSRQAEEAGAVTPPRAWVTGGAIAAGVAGLVFGAQLTVTGAVGLAQAAGVSEVVIALTLVAVGTSLPELAICLVAARQRQADLAVGNIVGSNIFNLAFILGLSTAIDPMPVPARGLVDVCVMVGLAIVLLPMAVTRRTISRAEGAVLLSLYVTYVIWLAMR